MKIILAVTLTLLNFYSFGQVLDKDVCKVEIYLLKKTKPVIGPSITFAGKFLVTSVDLAETPLIKNDEIISYNISNDTIMDAQGNRMVFQNHKMTIAPSGIKRLNNVNIPLCCGKQFAVVVNGIVVYGGYLWNILSSFGSNWITATAIGTYIKIERKIPDYNYSNTAEDPRNNQFLFKCLKATNRLKTTN